ncbi:EAL domain-containing protein [Hoeflea sp.]|uniref:putative bifunctional diguanylate cyclase/phosphodiesterase n=1 Tax=Hoeflea sp. TaxID=1940281 RepID=UPI00199E4BFE|nr:EAL domain-containing protein [Hoeflea sp.]MBC7282826.1 EAL domain-containing protein [Hoeflea sp.]
MSSPLGLAAIAAPMAVAGLVAGLERRHQRLARLFKTQQDKTKHLRQAAYHDSLTGLRNRRALTKDVDRILAGRSDGSACLTLLLFDLDRFKFINDTMGHGAGDAVLKVLADRLKALCGADRLIYRLGGDEFVVLWQGSWSQEDLTQFCDELISLVFRPVSHGGGAIGTSGSIGIAVSDAAGVTLSDLLKRADLALYRSKSKPGSSYSFFTEDMDSVYRLRRALEATMRDGIENGDFEVDYLPVVAAQTLTPSGFKARLRWNHPDHGDVAHDMFMPMAEGSGLIVLIGRWMLGRVLADVSTWHDQAEITLPVSSIQLQDPGYALLVLAALAEAGIAANRLVLDIRSNSTLGDCPVGLRNLETLRAADVRIAVSELAASVAGLSMARPYPVDKVRLDLGRIKAIAGEKRSAQMLNLFLQLAAAVGTPVTLTGVDTEDDLKTACAAAPAEVQGGFSGAPLCAEQARQFFTSMDGLPRLNPGNRNTPGQDDLREAC